MSPDSPLQNKQPKTSANLGIITVVLIYMVISACWILLSDKIMAIFFKEPAQLILVSIFKGWFFVGVSSILLYWSMRHWFGITTKSLQNSPEQVSLRFKIAFIALAGIIILFSVIALNHTYVRHRQVELNRLQSVVELKRNEVRDWLLERQMDAEFIRHNAMLAEYYQSWEAAQDLNSAKRLQDQLEQFSLNRHINGIVLYNAKLVRVWESKQALPDYPDLLTPVLTRALSDRKMQQSEPYLDSAGIAGIDFIAPLMEGNKAIALVVLHIGLTDWLLNNLSAWPSPGSSEELILFKKEGEQIVFINGLRFLNNKALMLSLPLKSDRLMFSKVFNNHSAADGLVEGLEYRGILAFGWAKSIPGTEWYLIAKEDASELVSKISDDIAWIIFVSALALVTLYSGYILLRKEQALNRVESVRKLQAERLRALQLLEAISESSNDVIYAKDLDGRYIFFNHAGSRNIGKPVSEVLGQDDRALFPLAQAEILIEIDRQVIFKKCSIINEEYLNTVNGERIFSSTKGPLYAANSDIIGTFGISRDITEQKRAAQALVESESRFRGLVEQSLAGIYVIQDEYLRYVNPGFAKMFGYASPEDIIDKVPLMNIIGPLDRTRVAQNVHLRLIGEVKDIRYIFSGCRADGSLIDLEAHGCAFEFKGRPAVIGLVLDITQRVAIEKQLKLSEERFQYALNATNDGIWDWDFQTGLSYLSPRCYKILGYRAQDVTADLTFLKQVIHPADYSKVTESIDKCLKNNSGYIDLEFRIVTAFGETKWIRDVGTVVTRSASGSPLRMVGVITDISARKSVEETLRRQAELLAERNNELQSFNAVMVGRELTMVSLKKQVNDLSVQLGRHPPFDLSYAPDLILVKEEVTSHGF